MAYEIEITDFAESELKAIRPFDRRWIFDEIYKQLEHQPAVATRNRKRLDATCPDFEYVPPIWELRIGEYRVFYDVNEATNTVYIRAIRRKTRNQTTEDILHERDDP